MTEAQLYALAEQVGNGLKSRGWMLVTAESCTGGWIGQAVTAVPGSSEWYDRGFITYSDAAKRELLGVSGETLARWGAVSEATVAEMAQGALQRSPASIAVAVSGIAGPTGATAEKPVGTVCIAWTGTYGGPRQTTLQLPGDRRRIRWLTVVAALQGVIELCEV